ncbi:MAG: oxidase, partial [Polyangiaceae bacterium]|nr:oxidase [Polyangiaceae bacterium]
LALGSEGTLGVITQATLRLHPLPEVQLYGSLVFPDWDAGCRFMKALTEMQATPASVRLVDNLQFQFGRALKPGPQTGGLRTSLQKFFLQRVKGIDLEKMVACTLVFEGQKREQEVAQGNVYRLARRFGGFPAGASAGKDGYNLTFGIAYLRDFLLQYWTMGDSFETSVPWSKVNEVIAATKEAVSSTHSQEGVRGHAFVTVRMSQAYTTGCCLYFYIGFYYRGLKDPLRVFRAIEHQARLAILDAGGALSHHHGIGQLRAPYLKSVKSEAALDWVDRAQQALDPQGIFRNGNQGLN